MNLEFQNEDMLNTFGESLGRALLGGETIQLAGDVGAGKTTLTKAIAKGMGITDTINSPSYALSLRYDAPNGLRLVHYDFYRLDDPGIMAHEIRESLFDKEIVAIVEWGGIVEGVLPDDRLVIQITPLTDSSRRLVVTAGGVNSSRLMGALA